MVGQAWCAADVVRHDQFRWDERAAWTGRRGRRGQVLLVAAKSGKARFAVAGLGRRDMAGEVGPGVG